MNTLVRWLAEGDLRTDGAANEVAALVQKNLELLGDLMEGLRVPQARIRGHAADALERVARSHPRHVLPHLRELIKIGRQDNVPMVRWHVAMILGHLSLSRGDLPEITVALLRMLRDPSVSVRSWAIASLCIVAREWPERCEAIAQAIAPLAGDPSAAIRTRVRKALACLTSPGTPLPEGWVKSRIAHDGTSA